MSKDAPEPRFELGVAPRERAEPPREEGRLEAEAASFGGMAASEEWLPGAPAEEPPPREPRREGPAEPWRLPTGSPALRSCRDAP